MDSKHTIELMATAFELVGVGILVLGSIIAFVHYLVTLIRSRKNHVAYRGLRLFPFPLAPKAGQKFWCILHHICIIFSTNT
jgi:hypothetical protein